MVFLITVYDRPERFVDCGRDFENFKQRDFSASVGLLYFGPFL